MSDQLKEKEAAKVSGGLPSDVQNDTLFKKTPAHTTSPTDGSGIGGKDVYDQVPGYVAAPSPDAGGRTVPI